MSKLRFKIIPVTMFVQNCTLLWCVDSDNAVLVDPGGDLDLIDEVVRQNHARVEAIWITHGHIDHVGAAVAASKKYGVSIIGPHGNDLYLLESLQIQAQMFGLPMVQNFQPSQWLHHGDSVKIGHEVFTVRHCPGHTPGHIIFYHESSKLALTGDVIFDGSVGRTDLPGGDHMTLLKSVRDQILTLPNDVTFIPGHGPISTIGEQRRTNHFLQNLPPAI